MPAAQRHSGTRWRPTADGRGGRVLSRFVVWALLAAAVVGLYLWAPWPSDLVVTAAILVALGAVVLAEALTR